MLISISMRQGGLGLGQLQLVVGDQALVGDRLEARGDLTGQPLGLLEVAGGAGEQEADDEDLGGDRAGQQRAQLEDLPVAASCDEHLEDDDGQRPRAARR